MRIRFRLDRRKILTFFGAVIVLIAIYYLLLKLWHCRSSIDEWQLSPKLAINLFFSSIAYTFICTFLVLAWYRLLLFFGQRNLLFRDCFRIYARSQIARYAPGNVFHIPARHIAGRRLGYDHGKLAGASFYEIIGILVGSCTLALLGYLMFDVTQYGKSFIQIGVMFTIAVLVPVILNKIATNIDAFKGTYLPLKKSSQLFIGLFPVYLSHFLYFLFLGGIFFNIVYTVSDISILNDLGPIFTVFAFSMIAGFITPGAPGGIGIREAIIVGFLGKIIGESECLFVAIQFRIITICGDLLFFLSSFLVPMVLGRK